MGGLLYTKLKEDGYIVFKKSAFRNILLRYMDTLMAVLFLKYDVLFIQGFALRAFYLESVICKIGNVRGKKVIYTIRGGAFPEFYQKNIKWCTSVFKSIDTIVTPSLYIQAFLASKNHKVEYIPNFIDLSNFPFHWKYSGNQKLLWVRSFHDIYKPELAIKAVSLLKQKYPNIHLTMVGPDQGKLAESKLLIQSLQLESNITITGPIANNKLNSYYCSHSIFITTTSFESFGVALMEAASSGIPMVSTSVGEIPYLWSHNENCLLVEDNNEQEFAAAIDTLFTDNVLQLKLSDAARKKAEQYTWDIIKKQWKTILQ